MNDDTRAAFALTDQQRNFFDAFGFLRLPGCMVDDIEQISAAFDEVFTTAGPPVDADDLETVTAAFAEGHAVATTSDLNLGSRRVMIPNFTTRHPVLDALASDRRILDPVDSLLPQGWELMGADGNIFDGDTAWHCDVYGSPLEILHIKVFFYLDAIDGDTGALRVVPGTSFHESAFAEQMRTHLSHRKHITEHYGIDWKEVPAATVKSEPGDVLIGNFRNVHATVNSGDGRRLFTLSFRER